MLQKSVMEYKFSRNTAIATQDVEGAVEFYHSVLGMPVKEYPEGPQIQAGAVDIFIDNTEFPAPIVLELAVTDLEAARAHLTQNGCEVLRWEGLGKACIVRDPYGLVFNVWQDP